MVRYGNLNLEKDSVSRVLTGFLNLNLRITYQKIHIFHNLTPSG